MAKRACPLEFSSLRTSHESPDDSRLLTVLHWLTLAGVAIIAFSYVFLLTLDPESAKRVADEDALVEAIGAAFLLIAILAFLGAFLASRGMDNRFLGRATTRNYWLLALALLMLLCLGEEISWGQRLLGLSTPEGLKALNAQEEINIHNLWLFQARNPDGSRKSFVELLLNANRLFSIFWLVYCVALPMLVWASRKIRQLNSFSGVPVSPLSIGALFLFNFALFKFITGGQSFLPIKISAFDELKETNYEFAFMLLAIWFLLSFRDAARRSAGATRP